MFHQPRSLAASVAATLLRVAALLAPLAIGAALPADALAQQSFASTAPITIPELGTASTYPSNMLVTGLKRPIAHMRVVLRNLTHTFPEDLGICLVGPQGQVCALSVGCGGLTNAINTTIAFDDDSSVTVPHPLITGTYRPSFCRPATFAAPGPGIASALPTNLGVFDGQNGNGLWSLYVQDFAINDNGTIAGGWELQIIEAGSPVVEFAGPGMIIPLVNSTGPASIYPSNIVVSGLADTITGVSVRLQGLTHAAMSDLDVLLVGPNGQACVLMSDIGGSGSPVTNATYGFTHSAPAAIPAGFVPIAGTYRPTNVGSTDTYPAPAPAGSSS